MKWTVILLTLFWLPVAPQAAALGLDFIERTSFNKDGSGLFSLKVDLTKSSRLIRLIKLLNKEYGGITKLIGYNAFYATKRQFKTMPGISGIRIKHDKKMLKFTLRFEFKTIQALNNAMRKMNQGIDTVPITYFSLSDVLFVREDRHGIAKRLIQYQKHDNCLVKSLNLASFFKEITYTTIYTFPRKIQDASNRFSEISKDGQTIRITHHILSAEETEESIANRVHFIDQ
jgi:hypothetical protein